MIDDTIINETLKEEICIISKKTKSVKTMKSNSKNGQLLCNDILLSDMYDEITLIKRFTNFKNMYISDNELINNGLNIRHQNTPEDISENITKFIIRKYENDKSCVWCKGIDKKYGIIGDLYSNKYEKIEAIEVKSFTSSGPSQFGPNKKFGVLYFLDLRNWLNNEIVLWKVNLNYSSNEFKNIKINKTQTMGEQLLEKRRPHISWDNIYPQISDFCEKIYEGTFENIF
jgi:ribosomal protein S24E